MKLLNAISQRARGTAVATLVALTVLTATAPQTFAQPVTIYTGPMCVGRHPDGTLEFFLPGEKVTDVNGKRWVCGADGKWAAYQVLPTQPKISAASIVTSAVASR